MSAKSVAQGGMFAALSLVLLLGSSLFPTLDYTLPAVAGLVPALLLIRGEKRAAVLVYAATSLLALLLLPRRDVALFYSLMFGHYPLTKSALERIPRRALEYAAKFAVCAVCMGATAAIMVFVMGLPLPEYSVWIWGAAGIVVFFLYDLGLSRLLDWLWRRFGQGNQF